MRLPCFPVDINGDGTIDMKDAILALKIITGILGANDVTYYLDSDVNRDGKIGVEDIIYILRYLM